MKSSSIQQVNLRFPSLNIRHTYDSKLQLEKFLQSDVGLLWAAPRYSWSFSLVSIGYEITGKIIIMTIIVIIIIVRDIRPWNLQFRHRDMKQVTTLSSWPSSSSSSSSETSDFEIYWSSIEVWNKWQNHHHDHHDCHHHHHHHRQRHQTLKFTSQA